MSGLRPDVSGLLDPNIGLISALSSSSPYAMFISFFTRRIRSGMPRWSSQQSSSMMLLRFSWWNTPQTVQAVGSGSPDRLSIVFSVNAVSSDRMTRSKRGIGLSCGHRRNCDRLTMPLSSGSISSPYSSCRPSVVPSYC